MKRLLILTMALLVACSSVGQSLPPPTSTPVPTATPIPLKDIDLSNTLVQPGDLPVGFSTGQFRTDAPGMFSDLPKADNTAFLQLSHNGDLAGGVTVFLYQDEKTRTDAFNLIDNGMSDSAALVNGIGTRALELHSTLLMEFLELAFMRCTAVAHIRMIGASDIVEIESFAKHLDKRLETLVCE